MTGSWRYRVTLLGLVLPGEEKSRECDERGACDAVENRETCRRRMGLGIARW